MLSEIDSYNKAKKFESQISNGRKIFRLFLWLNEVHEIYSLYHSEKLELALKGLKMFSCVCSFIYYFSDNIVWLSKIGYLSKFVPFSQRFYSDGKGLKWGYLKD